MRDFSSVLWFLFVIVLNKCEGIEDRTFVDLSRTRRQASDQSALPEGYHAFSEDKIAYKIYEDEGWLPWDVARERCQSDGGDLAIVDTADKIKFIRNLHGSSPTNWLFVGIYKPAGTARWKTAKGEEILTSSLPWISWATPNLVEQKIKCAKIVVAEMSLAISPCDFVGAFVCEVLTRKYYEVAEVTRTTTPATTTLNSTLPPPLPPLPTKATTSDHFPLQSVEFPPLGILYKFHGDRSTHHEARERCFSDGGRLAVVDSFEKINVISKILDEESVHVGIRVSTANFEEWVGDSDGVPLKDLPWTADNPHPAKCAALKKDGSGLEETLCSNRLQYLCEIRKIKE